MKHNKNTQKDLEVTVETRKVRKSFLLSELQPALVIDAAFYGKYYQLNHSVEQGLPQGFDGLLQFTEMNDCSNQMGEIELFQFSIPSYPNAVFPSEALEEVRLCYPGIWMTLESGDG